MKIEIISPRWREYAISNFSIFPPLSLPLLAALTPPDVEVSLTDEMVSKVDFDKDVDLVGITVMTPAAPKAYEMSKEFRKRGVKVVLGGIHPSLMPEEAAQHADAVVIGEAEDVWKDVIEDAKKGKLKKFYHCSERPKLDKLPIPRRDLLKKRRYLTTNVVQTTRGCPFDCDFCAVTKFFGRTFRYRPVDDVIKELETIKGNRVLFVDDNITGNPRYAKELFERLIPLKIKWISQSSITIAKDEKLLSLASKSGCMGLFIGLESLSPENLEEMRKSKVNKVEEFETSIKKIQDHGLGIEGAFIFGFDGDDVSVFERTVEFAKKMKLAAAQFGILTPFPGTDLFDKLEKENRIIDRDWSKYTISNVVFLPKKMSVEALQNGSNWAWHEFYSYKSIFSRILTDFKKRWAFFIPINFSFRRMLSKMPRGRLETT